ncbi:hypothetical protein U9M48_031549 [Paspalum notatum var. saurae]|uniref:Reverse transcriptase domain-containing protein n=1 Tax=Paspalum notatum var. saurae TaxID=547442 RepID=A0AAQ3X3V3_PASNO
MRSFKKKQSSTNKELKRNGRSPVTETPAFFQQTILKRSWKNNISYLMGEEGNPLTTQDQIASCFTRPYSLNVAFYRAAWPWVGDDIIQLIQAFYNSGNLLPQLNKTFIVLIPKKSVSINLRISDPLAYAISRNFPLLHAFLLEIKGLLLIIDLAKAFDKLQWNFILAALKNLGFNQNFINRVAACTTKNKRKFVGNFKFVGPGLADEFKGLKFVCTSFSVIVNGQPHTTFTPTRGIRKGCPLSPYLFVIAINELSKMLQEALNQNYLSSITLGPNCPQIHSLLFADNLIICGQASTLEAQTIHASMWTNQLDCTLGTSSLFKT